MLIPTGYDRRPLREFTCVCARPCVRVSHRNARDVTALPEFRQKVKLSSRDSNTHETRFTQFHTDTRRVCERINRFMTDTHGL